MRRVAEEQGEADAPGGQIQPVEAGNGGRPPALQLRGVRRKLAPAGMRAGEIVAPRRVLFDRDVAQPGRSGGIGQERRGATEEIQAEPEPRRRVKTGVA